MAVYRDPAPAGASKVSLFSPDPRYEWGAVRDGLAAAFGGDPEPEVRASHAVFVVDADAERTEAWLRDRHPELRIMSVGERIEIFKEAGLPSDFVARFALEDVQGSHALGHTRMATESRVTTQHSHPFSTGLDLCLVHNGSLSNHNRLRRELRREGVSFQTDNDTEVAAGYLTWRLREGADLREALEGCLRDLDGFFTFAVGTADGFAVLRDPIACKPAVLAETDDWVAMASEYRAIAVLPGAEHANGVGARAGDALRVGASAGLMSTQTEPAVEIIDLAQTPLRELNARLHAAAHEPGAPQRWRVDNPGGRHAIAVGLDAPLEVDVAGHVGYYCAGMNQQAAVRVHGNCGVGVAENIMSGSVTVEGNASQSAAATGRGGLVVIAGRRVLALWHLDEGRRHRRARIRRSHERLHGPEGSPAGVRRRRRRAGRLDLRGAALRARHRSPASGPTASRRSSREEHAAEVGALLEQADIDDVDPAEFRRYGSARELYNFTVDHAGDF